MIRREIRVKTEVFDETPSLERHVVFEVRVHGNDEKSEFFRRVAVPEHELEKLRKDNFAAKRVTIGIIQELVVGFVKILVGQGGWNFEEFGLSNDDVKEWL